MSKATETYTTKEKRQRITAWSKLWRKHNQVIAVLGCVVAFATSFALMLPVISFTQEAADEVGIVLNEQANENIQANDTAADDASEQVALVEDAIQEMPVMAESSEDSQEEIEATVSTQAVDDADSPADANNSAEQLINEDADDADEQNDTADDADNEIGVAGAEDDVVEASDEPIAVDEPITVDEVVETPIQTFEAGLTDKDDKVVLTVHAEAPAGALPTDAFMKIDGVAADKVQDKVEKAVRDAFGEKATVTQLTAVDIAFRNGDEKEIEPNQDIQVKITADCVRDYRNPVLVHVLDKTKESSKGKKVDAEIVSGVKIVNEDEAIKTVGTENTMKFEAAAFSPYVVADIAEADEEDVEAVVDATDVDATDVITADPGISDDFITTEDVDVDEGEEAEANEDAGENADEDADAIHTLVTRSGVYRVTVTYSDDAEVPEGARLDVEEIMGVSSEYQEYAAAAEEALGIEEGSASNIRLLDIKIVDETSKKVEIAAPVNVTIELEDGAGLDSDAQIVHFADDADVPDVVKNVDVDKSGDAVSFEAEGFSAYAIVSGPSDIPREWHKVSTIEELAELAAQGQGFYIGHVDGYYFTDGITQINNQRTGITKTKPDQSYPHSSAVMYYFEKVGETTGQYKVYCLDANNNPKYVTQSGNSLNFTANVAAANTFTVQSFGSLVDTFKVEGDGGYFWNMQGGANGASFAAFNNATDVNAKLYFWYKDSFTDEDPYQLDNRTYGLMNWSGGVAGKAMMASSSAAGKLDAMALTVLTKSTNEEDKLFASDESDISQWTFHWVTDDKYHLSVVADGSTKYLKIDENGLSLVSDVNDASQIQVIPGEGARAGQACLKANGKTLTFSGTVAGGFTTGGSVGNEWLYFVNISELTSDYFMTYSAAKVSVSDPSVTNGSRVIVYTRSWNEAKKRYEFFAIDHDGSLVPCFESGDSIEWVGNRINTLLWNFVEYYYEGTSDPSFYYELYNQYSEKYLAPQIIGNQLLSDNTIGINLNGRRNGKYYSSILAWDDAAYAYAGLKVENGRIVTCPKSEAMDFYFAIMEDLNVDDDLNKVPTVDNNPYGIEMKLIDIKTRKEMSDFLLSDEGGAITHPIQGLLSSNLGPDGYPTNMPKNGSTPQSLSTLYAGEKDVNHLFIESTYKATGYFEYDSAQSYATLGGKTGGDFEVYKELGTHDASDKPTLKHGQFFPYNDLEPGIFASLNPKNEYSATGAKLPDTDPRKNERLYLIKNPDYYFAMELKASFVQTPNGLDDWGHDIIFEFSGDDDFWLYVDDELVIDLGGIHSALPGSVNFKTGDVNVNGTHTTLRALFESNFRKRNPGATDDQVAEFLAQYFDDNSVIFKNNTTHTMRIFYMERGASASNLHMRFNLASVKPGTIQLSKELAGVDANESVLAEFPYQVWYKIGEGSQEQLLEQGDALNPVATYKDSTTLVPYKPSLTIDGITYEKVFMLKSGETAEINLPEGTTSYRIVECGVNTDVYSNVYANDVVIDGQADVGYAPNREDFGIPHADPAKRARVVYKNEVNPDALRTLTVTKKLFKEDGIQPIHDENSAVFAFRLYFATEFEEDFILANMYTYHVKDPNGNYCTWNIANQTFDSTGKTNYADLTDQEKKDASFTTSMNGSITNIPVDYTVEVRQLLAGTRYMAEERGGEIPDGYSLQKYVHYTDVTDPDTATDCGTTPPEGTTVASKDPHVDVCNLKGHGLRMNKTWTDADYMEERAPAYFAVFVEGEGGTLTLVDGSVRQLKFDAKPQTLYWYYLQLPVDGTQFEQYKIREVTLSAANPTVDENGVVTNYGTATPVSSGGEVTLDGKQKGETTTSAFNYTVTYDEHPSSDGSNVIVNEVKNDRPGIVLKKTDWSGNALADATFVLKDGEDVIGEFTSSDNGLITVLYLREGADYTLTESKAPQGYQGLPANMTIRLDNGVVSASGVNPEYYSVEQASESGPATVTVKDRPYSFEVIKKDGDSGEPLAGVHFELHRQVTVGGVTDFDLNPMPGYEDLVSGNDGVVPLLDATLPAGVYQLREIAAAEGGYLPLDGYIYFTVSATGVITPGEQPSGVTFESQFNSDGSVSNILTIENVKSRNVSFKKVDIADTSTVLAGAKFDLYKVVDGEREQPALISGLISGEDGMLAKNGQTQFALTPGTYHLVETKAPNGYNLKTQPVIVTVTAAGGISGVSYDDGTSHSASGAGRKYDADNQLYTLEITNSAGYVLPHTGGSGTLPFTVVGALLVLASALLFARTRRAK